MAKCRRKLKENEYYNSSNNRYEYHYTDVTGKKRVVTSAKLEPNDQLPRGKRGGKSLREKEAEIIEMLRNNVSVDAGKITVVECVKKYLSMLYVKKNLAYNTKVGHTRICKNLEKTRLGNMAIQDVKVQDCDDWLVDMCKKYKGSTLQHDISLLRNAFDFAVDRDWCIRNPARRLDVDNDTKPRDPLTFERMQDFLNFVKCDSVTRKYWEIIHVLFWTGLRAAELCGLTLDDLDFDRRLIYVHKQVQVENNIRIVKEVKTRNGVRVIPMTPYIAEVLKSVIEKRNVDTEPTLPSDDFTRVYSGFVFLTQTKTATERRTIDVYMKKCLTRYNDAHPDNPLPACVPHTARHTFCTNMQQQDMNIMTLRSVMGHANVQTTLNVYTGVKEPDKQVQEMDTIVTKMLTH